MLGGIQAKGTANLGNAPVATTAPLENTTGVAASGGYLSEDKDAKQASTAAKFGDVLQQIQSRYGAKAEKPREIKKTLGKDDFLRIMITQMQHQDPTKPFDAQQMAQQMAQYASVEQLQNVNQNLAKMQLQHSSSDRMAMTAMIGKTVTVDRERFPHAEGTNESLSFSLPKDASEVKISLISEAGEPILEKDLGKLKAGENTFSWDGLKGNTLPAKNGNYMFRVAAKDRKGTAMETNPETQGRIVGVSFEGSEPVFLIGDARHQEKITMKNIVRVDDAGPQTVAGFPGASPPGAGPKGNFISFQRGEGSSGLDASQASPDVADALAKYQQQRAAESAGEDKQAEVQQEFGGAPTAKAAGAAQTGAPAPQESGAKLEGFANGLRDGEDMPAANAVGPNEGLLANAPANAPASSLANAPLPEGAVTERKGGE